MSVLARQRQDRILEQIEQDGAARVSDLVDRLGVSDMTIRRDISVLARRGLVVRVHGGAVPVGRATEEPGFAAKRTLRPQTKATIAEAAAALVAPGDSVAISGGTTTFAVARAVLDVPDLTVVTNSVPVGELLHTHGSPNRTVILTGGERTPSDALVGPVADRALEALHVDWLFLGVHGIDERAGYTSPNLVEAATNRALIRSARHVAVVADSSKWGVVSLASMAALGEADVLVTDPDLDPEARTFLDRRVDRLVIATPS